MELIRLKTPSSSEHTRLASLESDAALLAAIGTAVYSSRQKMLEQYGTIELNDKFLENSHNFHLSAPHSRRRSAAPQRPRGWRRLRLYFHGGLPRKYSDYYPNPSLGYRPPPTQTIYDTSASLWRVHPTHPMRRVYSNSSYSYQQTIPWLHPKSAF